MKRAILTAHTLGWALSLSLLTACPKPPPIVPEGSRDLQPPSDAKKSNVYWRDGKGGTSQPTSAPTGDPPDWSEDVKDLPESNPLKTFQQKVLPNGLAVYAVAHRELPLFSAALVVPVGSAHDPKASSGLSALTADLLPMGANGKDAQAIATAVETLGANLSVTSGVERTFLSTGGLARDADTLLGLLADVTFRPTFDPAEFERAKKLRLGALLESFDDESQVAADAIRGAYFGSHPYGLPPEGTPKTLQKISLGDVKKFHRENFVPKGSFVVIVGDLDPKGAISLVEKHFGSWKGESKAKRALPAFSGAPSKNRVVIVDKPEVNQIQIRIAWKGVEASHPDAEAIELVNTTLGGGFTAHLMDELRVNAGYTYGAYSGMVSYRSTGYFLLRTFTKKESLRPALDLALKVVSNYNATKQSDVEFRGAKAYLAGQFPSTVETTGGLAAALAEAIFFWKGPKGITGYVDRLKSISVEKARATISEHLPGQKSPYTLVLVGPAEELKKVVEGLGEVSVVPLGEHFGGGV